MNCNEADILPVTEVEKQSYKIFHKKLMNFRFILNKNKVCLMSLTSHDTGSDGKWD